jgi:hypothetical protein
MQAQKKPTQRVGFFYIQSAEIILLFRLLYDQLARALT